MATDAITFSQMEPDILNRPSTKRSRRHQILHLVMMSVRIFVILPVFTMFKPFQTVHEGILDAIKRCTETVHEIVTTIQNVLSFIRLAQQIMRQLLTTLQEKLGALPITWPNLALAMAEMIIEMAFSYIMSVKNRGASSAQQPYRQNGGGSIGLQMPPGFIAALLSSVRPPQPEQPKKVLQTKQLATIPENQEEEEVLYKPLSLSKFAVTLALLPGKTFLGFIRPKME